MTPLRPRIRSLRYVASCAMWLVPPSMALLVVAACADSSESDAPDATTQISVPSSDSGDETSLDAAISDSDASLLPCGVANLCSAPTPLTLGFITAI
ncbi:MAG: hypothetical protein K0S65_6711, partial [Labilithrix sp.]|nr:hypothetical protein [Labilithrix sp.]